MAEKIKFAIVGAGRIGRRHASMVKLNEAAELVALIDTDISLKDELINEFDVPWLIIAMLWLKSQWHFQK